MPFAITNRKADNGFVFGNAPGNSIYYGTVVPKGKAAGFSPSGEGTGAQAEIQLFKTLKTRLQQTKRNVVFFVNGSAQDFSHVANVGATIEAEYGVEVVLLAWPSAENNIQKYKAHHDYVRGAAPMFMEILLRWLDIAGNLQPSRQVLFSHGLGNEIFEVGAQHPGFVQLMATFRAIVINAADVDANTHMQWVSRLGRSYVIQNANDGMLKAVEGGLLGSLMLGENPMKGKTRLGRAVDFPVRASQATYIDVTKSSEAGKKHEYYVELDTKSNLRALYLKLLMEREDAVDLAAVADRDARSGNLWHLR